MSTQRRIAVIAVALALVLALGWLALRDAPPAGGTAPGATAGATAAAAAASDARAAIQRIVAQAQIVPIDGIIEVRPLADGRVLRVLVHPGDRVAANQLLAEIESDLQSASVKQRTADLGAASERLKLAAEGVRPEEQAALTAAAEAARQQAELARDRWQRQRQLLAQRFVSEQAVIEAEHDLQAAEARAREADLRARAAVSGGRPQEVEAARHQVTSAHAAVTEGAVALSRTRIVAPIAGVVMTRNVNPGDIIGTDVTTPTLFRIVDPDRIEVRFEVEELLAARLAVGLAVQFTLPGRQAVIGRGHVIRIAPQVEKRSIGADDARIRADSLVRPAWSDFVPEPGTAKLPVNYRLEARVTLDPEKPPSVQ
jgi:multidrug resistance efflux pump